MSRQRGRASTASGSSQSTYCGEYTLLRSTNAATTRKASWTTLGRRGAASPSHAIPAQLSSIRTAMKVSRFASPTPRFCIRISHSEP